MNRIAAIFFIACFGVLIALQWEQNSNIRQQSADIHAIRETLAPFPISVDMKPIPNHVNLREDSHQEPEVTLL